MDALFFLFFLLFVFLVFAAYLARVERPEFVRPPLVRNNAQRRRVLNRQVPRDVRRWASSYQCHEEISRRAMDPTTSNEENGSEFE